MPIRPGNLARGRQSSILPFSSRCSHRGRGTSSRSVAQPGDYSCERTAAKLRIPREPALRQNKYRACHGDFTRRICGKNVVGMAGFSGKRFFVPEYSNTRVRCREPPRLSLRGHSMWPRQSPAYEWLRLWRMPSRRLRFARNDKEREPLFVAQVLIMGGNPALGEGRGNDGNRRSGRV